MKTIFITDFQHAKIAELAEYETKRRGKFVSLQDALEMSVDIGLAEIDKRKTPPIDAGQMSIGDGDL